MEPGEKLSTVAMTARGRKRKLLHPFLLLTPMISPPLRNRAEIDELEGSA